MRIGIITHNCPASKPERPNAGIFVYDFAQALQKLCHQVFVLCPDNGQKKKMTKFLLLIFLVLPVN